MDYRIWAVLGAVFIIAELHTLTFVFVFVGAAALITAIATGIGLTPGPGSQFVLFWVLSLASILILRGGIRPRPTKGRVFPDYLGRRVGVAKPISPGGEGSVYYRGAEWIAYSNEPKTIEAGKMVEIVDADGIRLCVRPVSETKKLNPDQGGL